MSGRCPYCLRLLGKEDLDPLTQRHLHCVCTAMVVPPGKLRKVCTSCRYGEGAKKVCRWWRQGGHESQCEHWRARPQTAAWVDALLDFDGEE